MTDAGGLGEPTATQYAEIGRYVCAVLGTEERWDYDVTQSIGDYLAGKLGYDQHPGNPSTVPLWAAVMDDIVNGRERARVAAKALAEETKRVLAEQADDDVLCGSCDHPRRVHTPACFCGCKVAS